MATSRMAFIHTDGKIFSTMRFHSNEESHLIEKAILDFLNPLKDAFEFGMNINDFNRAHFNCEVKPLFKKVSNDWYNTNYDYQNKWNCDYVYIKNFSSSTKYFVTPNGFIALPPEEVLTLHLGRMLNKFDRICIGDVINIADVEWIVLKKNADSVFCLKRDFVDMKAFDNYSPNYAQSEILTYVRFFAEIIKDKVGENALIPREIDLTTNEGKTDYGKITDIIGLLTEVEYKEFESIIKRYPVPHWWWLATAAPRYNYIVRCVGSNGTLNSVSCDDNYGVRPACLFSANIFDDDD